MAKRALPTSASSQSAREILLFTANALALAPLEGELRVILDSLTRAHARKYYRARISPAVTFSQVVHDLDDRRPAIVHFAAHGEQGGLVLGTKGDACADIHPSIEFVRR